MHLPRFLALTLPLLKTRQTFQTYDSCASDCFDKNLPIYGSTCTETVGTQAWISCICQDELFSVGSAVCIYTSCGATILNSTAQKHESNCDANGSPPAIDAEDFVTYGEGKTPSIYGTSIVFPTAASTSYSFSVPSETTYSLPTSTSASTGSGSENGNNNTPSTTKSSAQDSATQSSSSPASSTPASSNDGGGGNTLSTAALVGTIVGSVTGAIGSFAGVYFAYKSYKLKKEKNKEASEGQPHVVGT